MKHIPVLLDEVIDNLELKPDSNVVDCTLGDAGHSEKILDGITDGKLLGIDVDVEAVLRAKQYLYNFEDKAIFVRDNFANLKSIVEEKDFKPDGILIDLGWSTPQFKERGRGFSFEGNEPLDMRFEEGNVDLQTASELLNNLSEKELEKVFREFGEEKFSQAIAQKIVEKRNESELETTSELVEIVLSVYREKLKTEKEVPWTRGKHPATKVFQALRIAVNKELEVLKTVLPDAIEVLEPGGRLVVISFHSLEDRIVKHFFQNINNKEGIMITKKPITASSDELKQNPSARSAKLRVFQKL